MINFAKYSLPISLVASLGLTGALAYKQSKDVKDLQTLSFLKEFESEARDCKLLAHLVALAQNNEQAGVITFNQCFSAAQQDLRNKLSPETAQNAPIQLPVPTVQPSNPASRQGQPIDYRNL